MFGWDLFTVTTTNSQYQHPFPPHGICLNPLQLFLLNKERREVRSWQQWCDAFCFPMWPAFEPWLREKLKAETCRIILGKIRTAWEQGNQVCYRIEEEKDVLPLCMKHSMQLENWKLCQLSMMVSFAWILLISRWASSMWMLLCAT